MQIQHKIQLLLNLTIIQLLLFTMNESNLRLERAIGLLLELLDKPAVSYLRINFKY